MTPVTPNVRLLSLEVVCAVASFVAFARPRWWARRAREDEVEMQAVELRVEEDHQARTLRLPLPLTIGRAADAALVLQDAQVSRMHARLELIDGTLTVRDLGSRNGTLVNARPIDTLTPLRDGDEIDLGPAVRLEILGVVSCR